MARITVEDCLAHEQNRFALVILATRRAKQLLGGAPTVTDTRDNKNVVAALREIADEKVRFMTEEEVAAEEERERLLKEQREREEMARTATATDSLSSVFGDSPSSASENGSEDSSDSSSDEEE